MALESRALMVKLGFSLYPERHSLDKSLAYIDLLSRYGAQRLFLSLLQFGEESQAIVALYKQIIAYANDKGIEVVADISPDFVANNGWTGQIIAKAHEFGLAGIRLDEALPLVEIVRLTENPHGIKIELNSSTDKSLLLDLINAGAKMENLICCHNFYPHEYTALSRAHFMEMSRFYKEHRLVSSVFLSANTATEGPWPVTEGLPTLEELRYAPIWLQAEVLKATGLFDNIIISNQFIEEKELAILAETIGREALVMEYESSLCLTETEQKILDYDHVYRGDVSEYLIRSTWPRVKYGKESIPPRDQERNIQPGSIIIDNDLYTRYKGELQIALKAFKISEKANHVGQLTDESLLILDFIQPWQSFLLRRKS